MKVFKFKHNDSKHTKNYILNGDVSFVKYTNNVYSFRVLKLKRFVRFNKVPIVVVAIGIIMSCLMIYSVL